MTSQKRSKRQNRSLVRVAEDLINAVDKIARIDPAAVTQAERNYFSASSRVSSRRR